MEEARGNTAINSTAPDVPETLVRKARKLGFSPSELARLHDLYVKKPS